MDRFGYKPPASWNECLVYHTTSCRNAMDRPCLADRPIVLFTGIPFDSLRDMRGLDWGRPMLAKKPKRGMGG
jgi:hypothetical protein